MVTLFTGENQLEIQEAVYRLRQKLDPSSISTSFFEPPHDLRALQAALFSPGFFGASRLIIVHGLLSSSSGARRGELSESVLTLLRSCPDTTTLVLVELGAIDSRLQKTLAKAVPALDIQTFPLPWGTRLVRWVEERAQRYNAEISSDAAEQLVTAICPWGLKADGGNDEIPPDLFRLDQELAKLATAALPERHISVALIQRLVVSVEPEHGWALLNALERGDLAAVIREVEHELAQGTPPERLLAQLVAQFELYVQIQAAGRHAESVLGKAGISAGRLRHALPIARQFPDAALRAALEQLRQLDLAAKLGAVDLLPGLLSALSLTARHGKQG